MSEPSVFGFLFRIAARAHALSREAFLQRLVTGLANHYDAEACVVYTDGSSAPGATADPASRIRKLEDADRGRLARIEQRLVSLTLAEDSMVSGLDLEDETIAFLDQALGTADVFGFPLRTDVDDPKPFGALVIYLGEDARPFRDPDMYAMTALGSLVTLASERPQA